MSPATFENMFKITCITEMIVAKGEKTQYCDSMNNQKYDQCHLEI